VPVMYLTVELQTLFLIDFIDDSYRTQFSIMLQNCITSKLCVTNCDECFILTVRTILETHLFALYEMQLLCYSARRFNSNATF